MIPSEETRKVLARFIEKIEVRRRWADLTLPEHTVSRLREVLGRALHRGEVRGIRGLGVGVLFAGASGTGKAMAAEILAAELGRDLFRIDLSRVVSKFIGETEKNLRLVFDAAETMDAVLLFDEADALFGKRTDVKDSHDRFVNLESRYLLRLLETYPGLAILAVNDETTIDPAFRRRLSFIVEFTLRKDAAG